MSNDTEVAAKGVSASRPSNLVTAKANTAQVQLLKAHIAHPHGLTDEEAASLSGVSMLSEYATRCSELKRDGVLVDTSKTREGRNGIGRIVRKVTPLGISIWSMRSSA